MDTTIVDFQTQSMSDYFILREFDRAGEAYSKARMVCFETPFWVLPFMHPQGTIFDKTPDCLTDTGLL